MTMIEMLWAVGGSACTSNLDLRVQASATPRSTHRSLRQAKRRAQHPASICSLSPPTLPLQGAMVVMIQMRCQEQEHLRPSEDANARSPRRTCVSTTL